MKNKLFFLLGLPLIWLVVALVSFAAPTGQIYLLTVAPSVWLFLFVDPLSVTSYQLQWAALPVIFLVGLVLLALRMQPRVMIGSAIAVTFFLWVALLIWVRKSTAIRDPAAPVLWLLCCFNLSLSLLPFVASPIRLFPKLRAALRPAQGSSPCIEN